MVTNKNEENRKLPDKKESPVGWHAAQLQHHGSKLIIKGPTNKQSPSTIPRFQNEQGTK